MFMMDELHYFLGFQIHQTKEETFINQAKYLHKHAKNIWNRKNTAYFNSHEHFV